MEVERAKEEVGHLKRENKSQLQCNIRWYIFKFYEELTRSGVDVL